MPLCSCRPDSRGSWPVGKQSMMRSGYFAEPAPRRTSSRSRSVTALLTRRMHFTMAMNAHMIAVAQHRARLLKASEGLNNWHATVHRDARPCVGRGTANIAKVLVRSLMSGCGNGSAPRARAGSGSPHPSVSRAAASRPLEALHFVESWQSSTSTRPVRVPPACEDPLPWAQPTEQR